MADLPKERVTPGQPLFSHVGIDYFGPFMEKQGRSQVKRYGCIFTCLTMRAVHIEIAHPLETDSFINTLCRLIARRGKNCTSAFRSGTDSVFMNICCNKKFVGFSTPPPPAASHHGGIWERRIRTTRKILNTLLNEQVLNDKRLLTLMCEVEAVINGPPITKVSEDSRILEALSPNHFLLLWQGAVLLPGLFQREDNYSPRR